MEPTVETKHLLEKVSAGGPAGLCRHLCKRGDDSGPDGR